MKRSIEYIQDFLNVQGEKIWREEFARILHLAVEKEATRLVNKKYTANIDSSEKQYIPDFEPVDEHDFTFMGRLLTAILRSMGKGFYLDQMSTWYSAQGEQTFGLRFINFLHENLGPQFLQALDKLIVYKMISEMRAFYRDYSLNLGGGPMPLELQNRYISPENRNLIALLRSFDKQVGGNFENLSLDHLKSYQALVKLINADWQGSAPDRNHGVIIEQVLGSCGSSSRGHRIEKNTLYLRICSEPKWSCMLRV